MRSLSIRASIALVLASSLSGGVSGRASTNLTARATVAQDHILIKFRSDALPALSGNSAAGPWTLITETSSFGYTPTRSYWTNASPVPASGFYRVRIWQP